MPRKTRKQKERSHKRQELLKSLATEDAEGVNSGVVKREFEFDFTEGDLSKIKQSVVKKHEKSILLSSTSFVTQDLAKTLVIALGIFGLEVVLYLAWFKN